MEQFQLISLFKRRIGLWALGQALPKGEDLKPHLNSALWAICIGSAGGALAALGIAALLLWLYEVLIGAGMEQLGALFLVGVLILALSWVSFRFLNMKLNQVSRVTDSLGLFNEYRGFENTLQETFNEFVDGFLGDDEDEEEEEQVVSLRYRKRNRH